jgi:hypothetical protein
MEFSENYTAKRWCGKSFKNFSFLGSQDRINKDINKFNGGNT